MQSKVLRHTLPPITNMTFDDKISFSTLIFQACELRSEVTFEREHVPVFQIFSWKRII